MTQTATSPVHAEPARRGRFVLGAPDDPPWARPALWAILALATVLYAGGLSMSNANDYYAAAVLSGTHSWKAFFYGALDSGSYITVDKPPMALWVMGLSARAFGFGAWSILLPQVAEGVAAVAVLYTITRRTFGHVAGLIAALVLTLTPITVAINRDNNPDTLLVLLLVLAAWACLEAIRTGRLRYLLLCAVAVGFGFNTKMLQAFVVLPAFTLVYLVAAPGTWLRRIRHLLAAGVVLAVSSFWWMVIVDLTPASARPYIGSSTDNTVWNLVIGYNGLGRIFGHERGGRSGGFGGRTGAGDLIRRGGGPGGGGGFGGQSGFGRMFGDVVGGQISWLLPFAAVALIAGLIWYGRRSRTDPGRAALVLWGAWLVTHFVVFSFAQGIFHPYYTTAMAPAIAALTGAGVVLLSRTWALPLAIAATGVWSFVLLRRTPHWHPWLAWTVAAATAVAVVALVAVRLAPRARVGLIAVAAGLAAVLAGPAAYAASPLAGRTGAMGGSNPLAGPQDRSGFPGEMPAWLRSRLRSGAMPGQPGPLPGGAFGTGRRARGGQRGFGRDRVDTKMIKYLEAHQDGATWLVAVPNAMSAAPIILKTGKAVMALGGFSGQDRAMTVGKLQRYVTAGKLDYLLLGGFGPRGGGDSEVTSWVRKNCTAVKPSAYGASSSSSTQTLYRCG
jgi:4-amino-4-deoxy-L-arabinose transferase-like glycosyltransferase